ncbi:hypothetical protein ONA91_29845 [Micromonospora sp. DR5-3]|uniref:hypothetical protein n=1 Tax=unclassified Micromonospora TaxID=2617518 RepID=UPI0011D66C30|nr:MULTISPECIES: hypothetical protein [unclassified Micromonospora]MCW3818650.1 hypothetical protein [Micromonospora sp. DR5-3]TYC21149.1 hypothetical protein FXF52_27690 [Micromonospora sp. MP36]
MSLTGLPLLIAVAVLAVGAAVVTARTWHRRGRGRALTRAAAVLLTEVLALLAVGLAVNRAEGFYPTWGDLLPAGTGRHDTEPARAGRLDRWLASRSPTPTAPVAFPWHPPRGGRWPVTATPTVVVPADYPQHPTRRYPVIAVLADHTTGPGEATAARTVEQDTGPVIVVFTHLRPGAGPTVLTEALPAGLARDLRVTSHSWALIAPADLTGLARDVVRAAPARYPALALVDDAPEPTGLAVPPDLPATETVAVIGASTHHPGRPADRLAVALRWACRQTPVPLDGPAPLIPPPPQAGSPSTGG